MLCKHIVDKTKPIVISISCNDIYKKPTKGAIFFTV